MAACRIGILTIQEKWERWLGVSCSHYTAEYLQPKYPLQLSPEGKNLLINGHILPNAALVEAIRELKPGQELFKENHLVAKYVDGKDFFNPVAQADRLSFEGVFTRIDHPWELHQHNAVALQDDFELLTAGRESAPIDPGNQVVGAGNIFLEEGAVVTHSILNASTGPIYIGKDALIMEGCMIRGGLALLDGAVMKMGTKIYGAVTVGKQGIVGGEIKNSIFFDYSNKSHDGYIGDAVIGEWCNLGAGTSCSNIKNNGSEVKIWMEAKNEAWPAGLKCGVLMGDYSRCAIQTMFNTGTVIGVSCNIFGGTFPPKFVPSFTWGGIGLSERYRLAEALRDVTSWMLFKKKSPSESEKQILTYIFEQQNSGLA